MNFTDDEVETIKSLIDDWGSDCPSLSSDKVNELGVKLGIREPIMPPTEEELARQKAFHESPFGLKISEMLKASNKLFVKHYLGRKNAFDFMNGTEWPIGTDLRIRLPNDYVINRIACKCSLKGVQSELKDGCCPDCGQPY